MPNGATVTGDDMIKQLGLDDGLSVGACIGCLGAIWVGLLVLAYFGLYRTVHKRPTSGYPEPGVLTKLKGKLSSGKDDAKPEPVKSAN